MPVAGTQQVNKQPLGWVGACLRQCYSAASEHGGVPQRGATLRILAEAAPFCGVGGFFRLLDLEPTSPYLVNHLIPGNSSLSAGTS